MLLSEAFALLASPDGAHPDLGRRGPVEACLAALLIADLEGAGLATVNCDARRVVPTGASTDDELLAAAAAVVADKGPSLRTVIDSMDRGLKRHAGQHLWDAVTDRPDFRAARAEAGGDALRPGQLGPQGAALQAMAQVAGLKIAGSPQPVDEVLQGTTMPCLVAAARGAIEDARAALVAATMVAVTG